MRIRLKFSKQGPVRYVGHLDTMRLFQRAIKVAQIPVAYSQGFSPHSLIYFALPLAVGMASTGDYMEMILEKEMAPEAVRVALNKVLVQNIVIEKAFEVSEKGPSLMSLVQAADYKIELLEAKKNGVTLENLQDQLQSSKELIVMKKSKKGMKEVNLKPLILSSEIASIEEAIILRMKVLAGSEQNLNPDLLIKALIEEDILQNLTVRITREDMYRLEGDFIPLSEGD